MVSMANPRETLFGYLFIRAKSNMGDTEAWDIFIISLTGNEKVNVKLS